MRRRSLTLLWPCALFFARVASAQTTEATAKTAGILTPDGKRAEAEKHFLAGLELANTRQDWDAALLEFDESRRLFPTRSATRNAAIAMQHLGRVAEAVQLYDGLLEQFSSSLTDGQREALKGERAALLDRIGWLELANASPDTLVVVDGAQRGVTPLKTPIPLDVGIHTVRLSRDGFETIERPISVIAGKKRSFDSGLRPLLDAGTLVVSEANGEPLAVVLDSADVGTAPWRGNISAGLHSVLLRGKRRGTPPTAVDVKVAQRSTLVLRARVIDAEVAIQPTPASSSIFVDGVFVGSGAWSGALPSGLHRFEAVAPNYLPFRNDAELKPDTRTTVHANLVLNRPPPPPPRRGVGPIYFEPSIGLLFAHSLRGATDSSCNCSDRSRPFGWLAQGRLGYSLDRRFGLELSGGYLSLSESATRTMVASGEPGTGDFYSTDYRDTTKLHGPFAAIGASLRSFKRWPLTARMALGLARLTADNSNSGTFSGEASTISGKLQFSDVLSIPEPSQQVLTPFFSTELRFGYRFNERWSADLGAALFLLFPANVERSRRAGGLGGGEGQGTRRVYVLDDERIANTTLVFSPSAAVRVDF